MKYEKWSLGYWMLKQYIIFIDWIIYTRKVIVGKNKIPKNKPIVFAPNHQNALSDPMAVLLNTRFQPVWLARADIFKKGIVTAILRFLKIMPVYRMRDGKENLLKNEKTFADSVKILENNFALALFPEAAHNPKRQMLSHKKAVPRIVFMAAERSDYKLDIQIIPTGIYYSSYWKFNRSLLVNFGEPIQVNDFIHGFKQNQNVAAMQLRDHLEKAISELIINIKSKKYYSDFEDITKSYRFHFLNRLSKKATFKNQFLAHKILAEKLDNLEQENENGLKKVIQMNKNYLGFIKKLKLRCWLVHNPEFNAFITVVNKIILLFGFPVFLLGAICNAPPFLLIDGIVRKKVKDRSFWSTFFLVPALVLFPVYYLLVFFAAQGFLPEFWMKIAFLIFMPFSGKIAFKWFIFLRKTTGRIRLLFLFLLNKKKYKALMNQKKILYAQLDELISL